MNVFNFSNVEILAFSLVLLRVSSFVVAWPVFGTQSVPAPVKILLALTLSIVLLPVVSWAQIEADLMSNYLAWMAVREVCIGLTLGFLCRFFFFAVSIGGQVISLSMGLSNAQLLNPALGISGSAVEQFEVAIATLFFLGIQGHHLFLEGLAESFRVIPLSIEALNLSSFAHFGMMVQEVLIIGIKIAAPVMISIFFMNLAMGIVGRAVPQINVLVTSLPVNIGVGFLVLIISIPLFIGEMDILLNSMAERLFMFMKAM